MKALEEIRLTELKSLSPWTLAPDGAFVQVRLADTTLIGMKTKYKVANGFPDVVFVLSEGDALGLIAEETNLAPLGLDVSALVELAVKEAPLSLPPGALIAGVLYQHQTQDASFVWGQMRPQVGGFVCVHSNDPNITRGRCYPTLDRTNLVGIGMAALTVAESRTHSLSVTQHGQ